MAEEEEEEAVASPHRVKDMDSQDTATVHLLDHLLLRWAMVVVVVEEEDTVHLRIHLPVAFKDRWDTATHLPLVPLVPPNTPRITSTSAHREE